MPTVRTKAGRTRDLRPAMRIVALEGLFASASDYFSVPYVSLFALSLGASRTQIGLIAAVIALLGSVMQLPMAVLTEGRWSLSCPVSWLGVFGSRLLCFRFTPPASAQSGSLFCWLPCGPWELLLACRPGQR